MCLVVLCRESYIRAAAFVKGAPESILMEGNGSVTDDKQLLHNTSERRPLTEFLLPLHGHLTSTSPAGARDTKIHRFHYDALKHLGNKGK
jgi:hypothetical protein